ncbi:MAG: hypothetical protein NTV43_18375 [Methylococcales bacterium]|nr:hypothetical protein [Methylococcales bacterium]
MMMEELPIGKNLPPQTIKAMFSLAEDTPFNNKQLGYKILIQKNWEVDTLTAKSAELDTVSLKPIGMFVSPQNHPQSAYIHIYAVELLKEISAANLLRHYANTTGRNIINLQEISIYFADSLMDFNIENQSFIGRAAIRVDGNKAFMVFCFTKKANYENLAEIFGLTVASFQLTSPSLQNYIEHRVSIAINDIKFDYPASWQPNMPKEMPRGRQVTDLYHFDNENVLQGMIRIKVVEKNTIDSIEKVLRGTIDEFTEANVVIQQKTHQSSVESYSKRFLNGEILIYECTINNNPNELWICVFSDTTHYYVISLLTPARDNYFYTWALNRRAYDIVLESV